jgi:uncharacterized RDD family membrane protein YckC
MKAAGFWERAVAHLIDFLITNVSELAIEYGLVGLVWGVRRFALNETIDFDHAIDSILQQAIGLGVGLAIAYLYYVRWQVRYGNTLGKKIMKMQVVDAVTGLPMGERQAWVRLFSYLASYLIVGCGFLMAAFNPERRALHDSIAGTRVIRILF